MFAYLLHQNEPILKFSFIVIDTNSGTILLKSFTSYMSVISFFSLDIFIMYLVASNNTSDTTPDTELNGTIIPITSAGFVIQVSLSMRLQVRAQIRRTMSGEPLWRQLK